MKKYLELVVAKQDLNEEQIFSLAQCISGGHFNDAQIAGLIMGFEMKGMSSYELYFLTKALKTFSRSYFFPDAIDMTSIGSSSFDIMTASAFIAAGANVLLAKQISRSVTRSIGSKDLLEALGVDFSASPEILLKEVGLCFCFSPQYHPFMSHSSAPRKSLGINTYFDAAFALSHPFGIQKQVIGVSNTRMRDRMRDALVQMKDVHVLLLTGQDGFPGISLSSPSEIVEVKDQKSETLTVSPEDFGIKERRDVSPLLLPLAVETFHHVLEGKINPYTDLALLQAAAALLLIKSKRDFKEIMEELKESLEDGAAKKIFTDCLGLQVS